MQIDPIRIDGSNLLEMLKYEGDEQVTEYQKLMYQLFGSKGIRRDILEKFCSDKDLSIDAAQKELTRFILDTEVFYRLSQDINQLDAIPSFLTIYLGYHRQGFRLHKRLVEFSSDTIYSFFNFFSSEEFFRNLYLSFDGDFNSLIHIAKNELINPFQRVSSIHALNLLYAASKINKEIIVTFYDEIYARLSSSDGIICNPITFRTMFCDYSISLGIDQFKDKCNEMYQNKLLDEEGYPYIEAREQMTLSEKECLSRLKEELTKIENRSLNEGLSQYFYFQDCSDEDERKKKRNKLKRSNKNKK
jgi:hypothetical protein